MKRHAAFLRGMNLGRRRITNDELCTCLADLGFKNVAAFLASGNVVFEARGTAAALEKRIEKGLQDALEYEVPTFVRMAEEVRRIVTHVPFPHPAQNVGGGKLQVALLRKTPSPQARKVVLALSNEEDRLAIHGRELYWLPQGNLSDSALDFRPIDDALGLMTSRTRRTLERMVTKFFGPERP